MKSAATVLFVVGALCALSTPGLPWGADVVIHSGSVESFDVCASPSGDLYAAVVGTADQFGGQRGIYVYRSANFGRGWSLVIDFPTDTLRNVRLLVGTYETQDVVHLFLADPTLHRIRLRNLVVEADGRASGFADRILGSSTPGRCFEVARSYAPFGLDSESTPSAYHILAAHYVSVLNELHVFHSSDFGNSWERVLRVEDLAFGPLSEPEVTLSSGAGMFFLTYPRMFEDAEHWDDYTIFGRTTVSGSRWTEEWSIAEAADPERQPASTMYPQLSAADGFGSLEDIAWIILNSRDTSSGLYSLEAWTWTLPPMRPDEPDPEHGWSRQVLDGPSATPGVTGLDASSTMGVFDRDVHVLFDWAGTLRLAHVTPSSPTEWDLVATGMNDHPYFMAYDRPLRPAVICAPALPGAPSCPGIAYSERPPVPRPGIEGLNVYYDSSCNVSIVPHTTDPTEEWSGPTEGIPRQGIASGLTVLASSACGPTHSHSIEVAWSLAGRGYSGVDITVEGPSGVLATHRADELSSGATLRVSLAAGGTAIVTLSASDAAGTTAYAESQSVTLDPCP